MSNKATLRGTQSEDIDSGQDLVRKRHYTPRSMSPIEPARCLLFDAPCSSRPAKEHETFDPRVAGVNLAAGTDWSRRSNLTLSTRHLLVVRGAPRVYERLRISDEVLATLYEVLGAPCSVLST